MAKLSYAQRLTELAIEAPNNPAVTCGDESLTRSQLESAATRLGRDLQSRGVGVGDMVTISLPNSVAWFVSFAACWKIGAIPQPVSSRLPGPELAAILELADPKVVIGLSDPDFAQGRQVIPEGYVPDPSISDERLPDAVSPAWKAPTSGGSTGRPKLIVVGDPSIFDPETAIFLPGLGGCLIMPGPLYHNAPVVWSCGSLLLGAHVVVLPRFDAEATLAAVERYRGEVLYLVPTMMKRISRLPEDVRERFDLSSLTAVWHLAEPCPEWLKQIWIDWFGPERIYEMYAGTEGQAGTIITGTEWLAHRGSVGLPTPGTMQICDIDGRVLAAGERGEVWMRSLRNTPTYRYVGATARTRDGGWESLGDIGWLDSDGYLFLGDRVQDMILCGGANVYPAEVEAALQEHPAVQSCAVIGLPDEERGHIVHAIVEAQPEAVSVDELLAFVRDRLSRYKVPRSIEFTDQPLRDEAGKVRRSALLAERTQVSRRVNEGAES
jgi:bile acid-coenzyme A ligase